MSFANAFEIYLERATLLFDFAVIDDQPVRVEYHLTDWGQSLCPALDKLLTWAERQPSSPNSKKGA